VHGLLFLVYTFSRCRVDITRYHTGWVGGPIARSGRADEQCSGGASTAGLGHPTAGRWLSRQLASQAPVLPTINKDRMWLLQWLGLLSQLSSIMDQLIIH